MTPGERGRTHTLLVCGSASGHAIPPLMIFPRQRMQESLKVGAPPGIHFATSPKGWINQEIFLSWLDFFIANIPSWRPILLIYNGHASHLSIEVIEKARSNDIHLLCLPAHCTHILQPLDVSVMSSLKHHFYKACKAFLVQNPGRVITESDLAGLVGKTWALALTPSNLISGFMKTGIYPLNPGRITDRQTAPSRVYNDGELSEIPQSLTGYSQSVSISSSSCKTSASLKTQSTSVEEILVLPKARSSNKKGKVGLTHTAQYVSATPFLEKLRERKAGQARKTLRPKKLLARSSKKYVYRK